MGYKIVLLIVAVVLVLVVTLVVAIYITTYHPSSVMNLPVSSGSFAPLLKKGARVKVLTWNIQYLAGKNHVFFYDLFDGDGPDARPLRSEIEETFTQVVRIIKEEKPDIILLQEVHDNSKATDYMDQLKRIMDAISPEYCSSTSAYYWKASFVPHKKILGSVGMKLAVISKYKIDKAVRYQLPVIPNNIVVSQFNFKRAILEVRIPIEGGGYFYAIDTHLDAFAQGSDTMEKQVSFVKQLLSQRSKENTPWVIGGDFNLLAPGRQYNDLPKEQRRYFKKDSELASVFDEYASVPSINELNGVQKKKWYTHFPNDPQSKGPDRTIDYLFVSNGVTIGAHSVRNTDTLAISDHFPVIAKLSLPK